MVVRPAAPAATTSPSASRSGGTPQLLIGKELDRAINSPRRINLNRRGDVLRIVEAYGDTDGYMVIRPAGGMPRINVGRSVLAELRLGAGRYESVRVERGAIIVIVE